MDYHAEQKTIPEIAAVGHLYTFVLCRPGVTRIVSGLGPNISVFTYLDVDALFLRDDMPIYCADNGTILRSGIQGRIRRSTFSELRLRRITNIGSTTKREVTYRQGGATIIHIASTNAAARFIREIAISSARP